MKLTKALAKLHQQAKDLVFSDKQLTEDDKFFILENYHEAGNSNNAVAGAFFTPVGLASDLHITNSIDDGKIIDLCAGIGRLAYFFRNENCWGDRNNQIVCVELNSEYVEVGKRILPEATWINASIFDVDYTQFGQFDMAISNPPFGRIKTADNFKGKYKGAEFEFKCLELASQIATYGAFILPCESSPFQYINRVYQSEAGRKYKKFQKEADFNYWGDSCSIDASFYQDDWKGVKPACEVVSFEFLEDKESSIDDTQHQDESDMDHIILPCHVEQKESAQMSLF